MTNKDYEEETEEVLDIDETSVSSESMFHHKLRKKDRKIKNSESYKNNTIFYVVSLVALFVIWFTAFAQPLAYNNRLLLFNKKDDNNRYYPSNNDQSNNNNNSSNGNINNNTNKKSDRTPYDTRPSDSQRWDVGFVNMKLKNKVGGSLEIAKPSYTKTTASFHVNLSEPGDEISYNIDIKNSGTIDAKVSDITINPITEIDDPILFVFSGVEVGDELDAGKTTTVSVNIKYNPNYTGPKERVSEDFVVHINYVQK